METINVINTILKFMKDTILFGNGLNRVGNNYDDWNQLLNEISETPVLEDIPNTMKYESIILSKEWTQTTFLTINGKFMLVNGKFYSIKNDRVENFIKRKIRDKLLKYVSNRFYTLMSQLNIKYYLTTNYDCTLQKELEKRDYKIEQQEESESLYSIRRHCSMKHLNGDTKFIWPIHGSIQNPSSIMLGLDHYCGYVSKIDSYLKGNYSYSLEKEIVTIKKIRDRLPELQNQEPFSWIDLFFASNVHIIGLGLGYEEIDLWGLLTKRQRFIKEYGKEQIPNKIYFYGNIDAEPSKKRMLEILGVEIISIGINLDYESLYEKIFQIIEEKISNY